MQIHHLKYAIKIGQLGSFSAAAQALYVSQPALSQQIRELEQELGVKLFARHRYGVIPTAAGKEFIQQAEQIVRSWHQLHKTMEKYCSVNRGQFKIGVLWIWGYLGINSYLNAFQKLYPNLDMQFFPDGSVPLLERLKEGAIDCCIIIAEEKLLQNSGLYYHPIIRDQIQAILPAGHPIRYQSSVRWEDLASLPVILPGKDSASHRMITEQLSKRRIQPKIVCESTQSAVTFQLVSDGIGIGFGSQAMARIFQNPRFIALPLDPPIYREIYYITRYSLLGQPLVQEFTNYMKNYPS